MGWGDLRNALQQNGFKVAQQGEVGTALRTPGQMRLGGLGEHCSGLDMEFQLVLHLPMHV
ncbi:hypothetical protein CVO96_07135 [Deinococcus koreensis]|uniref:Uncharacterized protein n=1 Tax=Deinococcus koreensis TaxID=2054903 RepID=A0A2K3UXC4_9DEIO|nr:hypothetical protein CVO96_07135 [Deinococcus koreensis]